MGIRVFYFLLFFTKERVVAGLQRARAAGRHIGRVKTRPSQLIRALRASGMSLREISRVAKTSHGSVSLEIKEWKKEAQQRGVSLDSLVELHKHSQSKKRKTGDPQNKSGNFSPNATVVSGLAGGAIEIAMLPNDSNVPIELEITR